jgi:hypothetical protein
MGKHGSNRSGWIRRIWARIHEMIITGKRRKERKQRKDILVSILIFFLFFGWDVVVQLPAKNRGEEGLGFNAAVEVNDVNIGVFLVASFYKWRGSSHGQEEEEAEEDDGVDKKQRFSAH